jgi:membrane-associated phospholipid phosphatase
VTCCALRVTCYVLPMSFQLFVACQALRAHRTKEERKQNAFPGSLIAVFSPRSDTVMLRRLDRLIWLSTAAVATFVLLAALASNFFIVWPSFTVPALATAVLIGAAWFYRHMRPDLVLASALENTAQLIAFAAVAAPLSYIVAAANLPLQDQLFATLDRALRLDWLALLQWMDAFPASHTLLRLTYFSLTVQTTIAILSLALTGQLLQLRIYLLSFVSATLITIAISALLPGAGAWPYYGLSADPHRINSVVSTSLPAFLCLRDGSCRELMALGAQGIIAFPSLHAALAVILVLTLWPIPILRWVTLSLNLAMIASAPIDGSHHFTDVFAGLALGALCFRAAYRIAARIDHPKQIADAAIAPGLDPSG